MNTSAKSNKKNSTTSKSSKKELKTEAPLSEKDEVKKAEERTNKHQKDKS